MPAVLFHYADVSQISLKRKKLLKRLIIELFANEGKILVRLDYIFCSDNFLLKINQTHLHHDYYTDIISFDLSKGQAVTGEIYISVDRVKENAAAYSVSFQSELCKVIFHGALHLCDYNDKKKSEIIKMREKEDYYLLLLHQKLL